MQEQWTRWEPVEGLGQNYDILSCCDDYRTGFTIVLCEVNNPNKQLHLIWKNSVACYASANESYTFAMFADLVKYHDNYFFRDWTFFKVSNSNYLKRISISSGTVSDYYGFTHFAVISDEILIDVIISYEPDIKFVHLP
jgi:hypothetical protein